jgi:hypothetical protein
MKIIALASSRPQLASQSSLIARLPSKLEYGMTAFALLGDGSFSLELLRNRRRQC